MGPFKVPMTQLPERSCYSDNSCPVCGLAYTAGQELVRTQCRHAFHTVCYCNNILPKATTGCPICKGDVTPVARYAYQTEEPAGHNTGSGQAPPRPAPSSSASSWIQVGASQHTSPSQTTIFDHTSGYMMTASEGRSKEELFNEWANTWAECSFQEYVDKHTASRRQDYYHV